MVKTYFEDNVSKKYEWDIEKLFAEINKIVDQYLANKDESLLEDLKACARLIETTNIQKNIRQIRLIVGKIGYLDEIKKLDFEKDHEYKLTNSQKRKALFFLEEFIMRNQEDDQFEKYKIEEYRSSNQNILKVLEFYNGISPMFCEQLKKCLAEKRVKIVRASKGNPKMKGLQCYLASLGKSYTSIYKEDNLLDMDVLTHEAAHEIDMENNHFKIRDDFHDYIEVLPYFAVRVFHDHLLKINEINEEQYFLMNKIYRKEMMDRAINISKCFLGDKTLEKEKYQANYMFMYLKDFLISEQIYENYKKGDYSLFDVFEQLTNPQIKAKEAFDNLGVKLNDPSSWIQSYRNNVDSAFGIKKRILNSNQ